MKEAVEKTYLQGFREAVEGLGLGPEMGPPRNGR